MKAVEAGCQTHLELYVVSHVDDKDFMRMTVEGVGLLLPGEFHEMSN